METLNFRETVKAEIKEAKKAQRAYHTQLGQVNRRLYYIPVILHTILVVAIIGVVMAIVWFSGYISGEASVKCPTISCPLVQTLPQTGASF